MFALCIELVGTEDKTDVEDDRFSREKCINLIELIDSITSCACVPCGINQTSRGSAGEVDENVFKFQSILYSR